MNHLNSTADSLKKKAATPDVLHLCLSKKKCIFPRWLIFVICFLHTCMKNSQSNCKNVVNNKCFSLINLFLDIYFFKKASEQKELSLMTGYYFGFLVIIFSHIICLFTQLPKSMHKNREFLIHWHY